MKLKCYKCKETIKKYEDLGTTSYRMTLCGKCYLVADELLQAWIK